MSAQPSAIVAHQRCQFCRRGLAAREGDNLEVGICALCIERPSAKRLLESVPKPAPAPAPAPAPPAREFTKGDRSLIRQLHGFMPQRQLLQVLNERLAADMGAEASPYTLDQLHAAIGGGTASEAIGDADDWSGLRRILARARRDGTLRAITPQIIEDFATVFAASPAQLTRLQDIVLAHQEQD